MEMEPKIEISCEKKIEAVLFLLPSGSWANIDLTSIRLAWARPLFLVLRTVSLEGKPGNAGRLQQSETLLFMSKGVAFFFVGKMCITRF